jgi:AcrR family transcriptional regulator
MKANGHSIASVASDGRVRRGLRTGQAIVDAMIELVGEGTLAPTAHEVAARAGVGIRTVFRRFSDMEGLFAEMGGRVEAAALPLLAGGRRDGDLAARGRALVAQRVALFERIAPYKRSGNLKRWRSPTLRARHEHMVRLLRADLPTWFPELRDAPASIADALELATSFEAWDRLRTEQRLGPARARAALERSVLALIRDLGAA